MKVLQASSGEEFHTVWTDAFKRLIHPSSELRNKRRALERGSTANKIMAPYEGRRWCDATERELIAHIMNAHGYL